MVETERETRIGAAPRLSRPARLAVAVAAAVLALVALGVLLEVATASPRVCASCHEMDARTASWRHSAHVGVACVACHETPRPWYALPWRLAERAGRLSRDLSAHFSDGRAVTPDDPVFGPVRITDAACLRCHDPRRKATSGFRILIDHPAHAKRNGSCISCHIRVAHPVATRGAALSLMAQCFTCHGRAKTGKASGRCGLCHPKGYPPTPASHRSRKWAARHGKVARADLPQCGMCHVQQGCDSCHGVQMPHPVGWAKGRPGHAEVALRDRAVCGRCHSGTPDMCSMCHHRSYDPSKGTWAEQHSAEVKERGTPFCVTCHSPLECVRCHTTRGVTGP